MLSHVTDEISQVITWVSFLYLFSFALFSRRKKKRVFRRFFLVRNILKSHDVIIFPLGKHGAKNSFKLDAFTASIAHAYETVSTSLAHTVPKYLTT